MGICDKIVQGLENRRYFYAWKRSFEDSKGRRIVIGWMGVPDAIEHKNPTIDNFW